MSRKLSVSFPDSSLLSIPEYDVVVARNHSIPTRDGISLISDIYFPARGVDRVQESLPVILIRTPYDKNGSMGAGIYYAKRGYIFVAQDVRGRYASGGEFFAFADEGEDGCDAVRWISEQPWCNGRIGTMGASYCAAAQSALACFNPPGLSAMIVQFGPSSYFHSSMRHNGVLELRFLVYAFSMAASSREAAADPGLKRILTDASEHAWDYIKAGPIRPGSTPLSLTPNYERWAIEILTRPTHDDFWQRPGFGPWPHYEQHADVPTLYVGGWYDTYTRGTLENFRELARRKEQVVHALVGPWTHGGVGIGEAGDADFRPAGQIDFEAVRLQWFDQWLKGKKHGLDEREPVTYFLMGTGGNPIPQKGKIAYGGEWRQTTSWPPAEAREKRLYLHAEGKLSQSPQTGNETESTSFVFDPANPVPTIGGNLSAMPLPPGAFNQVCDPRFPASGGTGLPLAVRQDILVFQTEVLPENLDIAGPITVSLVVSSDSLDTDFTAKLIDIFPPSPDHPGGLAVNLTDGICRLRFRNGFDNEELAEPGKTYELTFELFPTACRICTGHRLRLDISSSNYPRFELNPNTGEPCGKARMTKVATNAVYHGPDTASHISIWTVP